MAAPIKLRFNFKSESLKQKQLARKDTHRVGLDGPFGPALGKPWDTCHVGRRHG